MTYGNGFVVLGGISFKEDRVRVVWMEVSGGIVRARVVSRVVLGLVMRVVLVMLRGWEAFVRWFWMGELSLEEMSIKRDHHVIHKIEFICEGVWVIDMNMLKEPSEKHSIGKCHIGILGHAYHSVDDVVGKVEVFSNGEAVKHVAQTRVRMVLVSSETYSISTQDDFPFLEIDFQLEKNYLKMVKEGINPFHLSGFRLSSFIEQSITDQG
ncbi:hypothetical protein Tco_0898492 [Tanacetum coccineum]